MKKSCNNIGLQMLRKLYGYDLSLVRQKDGIVLEEQDEFESLALYHLDKQVTESVQEFMDMTGGDSHQMDSGAIAILMGVCGIIMAEMQNKYGKAVATSAIRFGKRHLEKRYSNALGEKTNDN